MVAPLEVYPEVSHYKMPNYRFSGKIMVIKQDGEYVKIIIMNKDHLTELWLCNVEMCDLPKWVKVGERVDFDSATMRIMKA